MPIRVLAMYDPTHRSARIAPSGEFKALPKKAREEISDRVASSLPRCGGARLASMDMDGGVLAVDHAHPDAVETVRARFEEICQQVEADAPQPGPVSRVVGAFKERVAQWLLLR